MGVWLTFDDGFIDHYEYVLPELVKNENIGNFFPSVYPIEHNRPLSAHLIHLY